MWEKRRRSVLQSSRANGDWMSRALHYGSGEGGGDEKGRRRGGEKRAVCAAHGDRAAVGVDIDAQGSSFCEDDLVKLIEIQDFRVRVDFRRRIRRAA